MNYIIHTPSAARLKKDILNSVEAKMDANGKGIVTWQIAEADAGEKVLVHTRDQWAEKGGIVLGQVPGRNELQVKFCCWESCEGRNNDDDKVLLGRFTELVLVHFAFLLTRSSLSEIDYREIDI